LIRISSEYFYITTALVHNITFRDVGNLEKTSKIQQSESPRKNPKGKTIISGIRQAIF